MAKQPGQRPAAKALPLELLGDHAEPDPQAAATQLPRQSWSPPATPPPAVPPPPAPAPAPAQAAAGRRGAGPGRAGRRGRSRPGQPAGPGASCDGPTARAGPVGDHRRPGRDHRPGPAAAAVRAARRPGDGGHAGHAAVRPRVRGRRRGEGRLAAGAGGPAPGSRRSPVPERLHADLGAAGRTGGGGTVPVPREARRARHAGPAPRRLTGARRRAEPGAAGHRGRAVPPRDGRRRRQLVMFVCNDRVLQLHVTAADLRPDPLLVQLAQGANRRLHERTGCPL
jgi:hypothetical protein